MIAANSSTLLPAPKSRVPGALLADRADPALIIVVAGIDQCVVGQAEDLVVHRLVERHRAAALEVGPPAAVDQQGVAGHHRAAASTPPIR